MRCDSASPSYQCNEPCFNPHTYMRCDIAVSLSFFPRCPFQSTHLHEVWHVCRRLSVSLDRFNPHTYMRCDFATGEALDFMVLFQSTHLHEVWRYRRELSHSKKNRFNPHTYMRCDLPLLPDNLFLLSFNPHTYMRCDPINSGHIHYQCVSIHTPT